MHEFYYVGLTLFAPERVPNQAKPYKKRQIGSSRENGLMNGNNLSCPSALKHTFPYLKHFLKKPFSWVHPRKETDRQVLDKLEKRQAQHRYNFLG